MKWVSVDEAMPEIIYKSDGSVYGVLALYKPDSYDASMFRENICNTEFFNKHGRKHYSHWMYLPDWPDEQQ